ncbi:MAG: hypothetical protein ABFD81_14545 [Syntrophaceae bacterium]
MRIERQPEIDHFAQELTLGQTALAQQAEDLFAAPREAAQPERCQMY